MTTGGVSSNGAKDVRHRKQNTTSKSSTKPMTSNDNSTNRQRLAPRPALPQQAPHPSSKQALEAASSSIVMFALVSLAVAAAFLFLGLTATRIPSDAIRAVVIDAGSTGTRAQLFTFTRAGQPPHELDLVSTELHQVPVPLAVLAVAPSGPTAKTAADNLFKPLLEKLNTAVPSPKKRSVVPIILRATAGLRMLGSGPAELALDRSRSALAKSGFLFRNDWVQLLDERDEGVHAWTTVNYLLGNLRAEQEDERTTPAKNEGARSKQMDSLKIPRSAPVGILDLGGASIQIVSRAEEESKEVQEFANSQRAVAPEFSHAQFLNRSFRVLSKSHLGFGLLDFTSKLYAELNQEGTLESGNPCFKKGRKFVQKTLRLRSPTSESTRTMTFLGDGDFSRCVAACEKVLSKYDVPGDSVLQLAGGTEFYAFAYFYDRTVGLGLPESPTKDQLTVLGNILCGTEVEPLATSASTTDETCVEYSYVYSLLKRMSRDFDPATGVTFKFVQYVNGHMLGWALGTVLDQLPHIAKLQLQTLAQ